MAAPMAPPAQVWLMRPRRFCRARRSLSFMRNYPPWTLPCAAALESGFHDGDYGTYGTDGSYGTRSLRIQPKRGCGPRKKEDLRIRLVFACLAGKKSSCPDPLATSGLAVIFN